MSEAEAVAGLGFADVSEMRRWETEAGQRLARMEEKLRGVTQERDQFLWTGRRMEAVLERVDAFLAAAGYTLWGSLDGRGSAVEDPAGDFVRFAVRSFGPVPPPAAAPAANPE